MEPWISMPKNIPKELEERAEEICRKYDIQRSNSDEDLVKVPRYRCACTKKNNSQTSTGTCARYIHCPFIGQVQAVLREAARGCQPGTIKDSKTIEKKTKK